MSFEIQPNETGVDRVISLFHQSIEAKMADGERLAPSIQQASALIASRLLEGKKILCCGNGTSASMASILVQNLMQQYQMERPGFAAMALGSDIAFSTAVLQQNPPDLFAQSINALGNQGDVLVAFSHGNAPANIIRAIQAAHNKEMACICFSAIGDENITASLSNGDCQVKIENQDRHRVSEIQLLSIYALCDLIDFQLFGGM